MDSRWMMEAEEEEELFEGEASIIESEEEEELFEGEASIIESQEAITGLEEESEVEQLEEMRPPVVTSWMTPDGITVHGIMCIDDGVNRLNNKCPSNDCSICFQSYTSDGQHQMCCLPCGNMYGLSCIKKWLLLSSPSGKCPQCNTVSSFRDAILLYPPTHCATAHQKEASSATLFPFTEQGFLEFQKYESSRVLNAQTLRADDTTHMNNLLTKRKGLADHERQFGRQLDHLLTWAQDLEERADSLGLAAKFRMKASQLKPEAEALGRRTDAMDRLLSALRRRIDALQQRVDASESRIRFYYQAWKEHLKREKEIANAELALEMKKKLPEKAAANANKKGEKEVEKKAEKKLKDKELKDEKKIQAPGTVDVPEEEMVEDIAEEPEEEKVEVKAEPTTKTTERLRVRSSPDSKSKMIHKHKKSNNYMYYYAAVLTLPFAVGYTLYA